MNAREARTQFEKYVAASGVAEPLATPEKAFTVMFRFYGDCRADDVDIDADGDMLLFQWGMHDWGEGPRFEVDLTRQLIATDGEDDDIWQLHLTYRFAPTEDLRQLGSGHRWCTKPELIEEFQDTVLNHPTYRRVASRSDGTLELDYECTG